MHVERPQDALINRSPDVLGEVLSGDDLWSPAVDQAQQTKLGWSQSQQLTVDRCFTAREVNAEAARMIDHLPTPRVAPHRHTDASLQFVE